MNLFLKIHFIIYLQVVFSTVNVLENKILISSNSDQYEIFFKKNCNRYQKLTTYHLETQCSIVGNNKTYQVLNSKFVFTVPLCSDNDVKKS